MLSGPGADRRQMSVKDLPESSDHPEQVFITADLKVTTTDPETQFSETLKMVQVHICKELKNKHLLD